MRSTIKIKSEFQGAVPYRKPTQLVLIEFPEARIVVVILELLSQNLALQASTPPFPHKC